MKRVTRWNPARRVTEVVNEAALEEEEEVRFANEIVDEWLRDRYQEGIYPGVLSFEDFFEDEPQQENRIMGWIKKQARSVLKRVAPKITGPVRHTIGGIFGGVAGGGTAELLAQMDTDSPEAMIATGVAFIVYAAVEKQLKRIRARITGEPLETLAS